MRLDERGQQCPKPVIDTKKALESCQPGETVEVLVDNEIAVQNLRKMAGSKSLTAECEKLSDHEFLVKIQTGDKAGENGGADAAAGSADEAIACQPDSRKKGVVVVLSSNLMGHGEADLGKALMKGFVYALTQQDNLPEAVLIYNSGAYLSCEGSDNLEDLKALEAQGVEILTCGTCLNFYGLGDKLKVGSVTNMYEIVERMTTAGLLVRP